MTVAFGDTRKLEHDVNYTAYISSHRWRNNGARLRELAIAGGQCRLCGYAGPLEVHHRDYVNLGDERDGDLIALCITCHREVTCILRRRRYQALRPLSPDAPRVRGRRLTLVDPTRGSTNP